MNGHSTTSAASVNTGHSSAIRPRADSLPQLTQVRSIDEALSPPPPVPTLTPSNPPPVRAPASSATPASPARTNGPPDPPAASIRFTPHIDIRSSREALTFSPVERILRTGDEVIRVGRYSERENQPNNRDPYGCNTAPVGFKSKVVSRRHCEFWYDKGQWYVKDVKSSSGTFLNHIRLSAPGVESRAYPIFDGDILQLGIDFKGGEEPIFRCVKIRVELNRAWQKGLNNFNMSAHKRIRNMAASSRPQGDTASLHTSECSICLMSVAPCQALFVAPCSHVWHYKCIRPLVDKGYPVFLCPNCRAIADLERDIDEDEVLPYIESTRQEEQVAAAENQPTEEVERPEANDPDVDGDVAESAVGDASTEVGVRGSGDEPNGLGEGEGLERSNSPQHTTNGRRDQQGSQTDNESLESGSSSDNLYGRSREDVSDSSLIITNGNGSGGPMTPRNDIGPFVFVGAARDRGRDSEEALVEI
ncbi:hypothetical protein BDZ91DRAFT_659503 [Kalaharituber pfeilii]|nr:hypothetical protein BDZ91DRAFT_659503 [Kalaharituber pfeilii]